MTQLNDHTKKVLTDWDKKYKGGHLIWKEHGNEKLVIQVPQQVWIREFISKALEERDQVIVGMLIGMYIPHEYDCRADKGEMTEDCTCKAIELNYSFNQAVSKAIQLIQSDKEKLVKKIQEVIEEENQDSMR